MPDIFLEDFNETIQFPEGMSQEDMLYAIENEVIPFLQSREPSEEEEIGPFGAGRRRFQQATEMGIAKGASALGFPETAKTFEEMSKATGMEVERRYAPDFPSIRDIDSPGDVFPWLYEKFGESATETGIGMVGAGAGAKVGAAIGTAIAPGPGTAIGAGAGAIIGGGLSLFTPFFGRNIERQMEEQGLTLKETDGLVAAAAASAQAPLDAILDRFLLTKIPGINRLFGVNNTRAIKEETKKQFSRRLAQWAGSVGRRGLEGAGIEATTESLQEALELLQANPDKLFDFPPQVQWELLEAAVAGGALGGVLGGSFEAATEPFRAEIPAVPSPVEADQPQEERREEEAAVTQPLLLPPPETPGLEPALPSAETLYGEGFTARTDFLRTPSGLEDVEKNIEETPEEYVARQIRVAGADFPAGPFSIRATDRGFEVRSATGRIMGSPAPTADEAAQRADLYNQRAEAETVPISLEALPTSIAALVNRSRRLAGLPIVDEPTTIEELRALGVDKGTLKNAVDGLLELVRKQREGELAEPSTLPIRKTDKKRLSGERLRNVPITNEEGFPAVGDQVVVGGEPRTVTAHDLVAEEAPVRTVPDHWAVYEGGRQVAERFPTRQEAQKYVSRRRRELGKRKVPKFEIRKQAEKRYDWTVARRALDQQNRPVAYTPLSKHEDEQAAQQEVQRLRGELPPPSPTAAREIEITRRGDETPEQAAARVQRTITRPIQREPLPPRASEQIAKELRDYLNKIGLNKVGLRLTRKLDDDIEGTYDALQIVLANVVQGKARLDPDDIQGSAQQLKNVLRHEVVHALRDLDVFTPEEWSYLVNQSRRTGHLTEAQKTYPDLSEEIQQEEAVANLFRDWADNPGIVPARTQSLFRRLVKFIASLFGINLEQAPNVRRIFEEIETGARAEQIRTAEPKPKEVNEAVRQARVRNLEALNPQIHTKEFKDWFGNSKIVDEFGLPKIVYHSTIWDFSEFDVEGLGSHFGETPKQANNRLIDTEMYRRGEYGILRRLLGLGVIDRGVIMPVFLRIEKPLRMLDAGEWKDSTEIMNSIPMMVWKDFSDFRSLYDEAEAEKETFYMEGSPEEGIPPRQGESPWTTSIENQQIIDEIKTALKERGYDGVIYQNEVEGRGESYIVFDPEQVKSATGNMGAFDPTNPDIRQSRFREPDDARETVRFTGPDGKKTDVLGRIIHDGKAYDVKMPKGYDYWDEEEGIFRGFGLRHAARHADEINQFFGKDYKLQNYIYAILKKYWENRDDPSKANITVSDHTKSVDHPPRKTIRFYPKFNEKDRFVALTIFRDDFNPVFFVNTFYANSPDITREEHLERERQRFEDQKLGFIRNIDRKREARVRPEDTRPIYGDKYTTYRRMPALRESPRGWADYILSRVFAAQPNADGSWENWRQAAIRNAVNKFLPMFRLDRAAYGEIPRDGTSVGQMAELTLNLAGRMETLTMAGPLTYNRRDKLFTFTDENGDPLTDTRNTENLRGLFTWVFKDLPPEMEARTGEYFLAVRHLTRINKGLSPVFFQQDEKGKTRPVPVREIKEIIDKATPEMVEAHRRFQKFNSQMVKAFGVNTGLITPDLADNLADLMYVPAYRLLDPEELQKSGLPVSEEAYNYVLAPTIRKEIQNPKFFNHELIGGEQPVGSLFDNIFRNYRALVRAGTANVAAQTTADALNKLKSLGAEKGWGYRVAKKQPKTFTFSRDGVDEHYVINDGALWIALTGLGPNQKSELTALASKFSNWLRMGVTHTPAFMMANLWRGKIDAWNKTEMTADPLFLKTARAMADTYRGGLDTWLFKAHTGMGGYTYGHSEKDHAKEMRRRMAQDKRGWRYYEDWTAGLKDIFAWLEKVGETSEFGERIALQQNLIERGMNPATAMYEAMNVINFGRHGSYNGMFAGAIGGLIPMVPFLNARIQGLYRLFENQRDQKRVIGLPLSVFVRGMLITAASTAIWALNADDDRWDREGLERKTVNDIFYIGDKTVYLPRAFEVGSIFGTLPVMLLDAIRQETTRDFSKAMASTVLATFAFNPIPQIIKPGIEVFTNFDFFGWRNIESLGEQSREPEDRYRQNTTEFSKFLGRNLDISPLQLDHLVRGYLGSLSVLVLSTMDSTIGTMGFLPAKPHGLLGDPYSPQGIAASISGIRRFVKDEDEKVSRSVNDFYEMKREVDQAWGSLRDAAMIGEVDRINEIINEQGVALGLRRSMNRMQQQLTEVNASIKMVRRHPTMSSEEKTEILRNLRKARNTLTKVIVDAARRVGLY